MYLAFTLRRYSSPHSTERDAEELQRRAGPSASTVVATKGERTWRCKGAGYAPSFFLSWLSLALMKSRMAST